jgi:hypothetical protein
METVFYSWQSDLPNATNRGLIQDALEIALVAIREGATIEEAPRIDKDTADVPGSPDIAATIFAKIDAAAVFVCDVSLVSAKRARRKSPNPNVLIELGYARKSLGFERVIMVFNTTSGSLESLPFDLRGRKAVPYQAAKTDTDRAAPRKDLAKRLEAELRKTLAAARPTKREQALSAKLIESVQTGGPDQAVTAREYMQSVVDTLDARNPDVGGDGKEDLLLTAIQDSIPLVEEFSLVCQTVARRDSEPAALALAKGFRGIVERGDVRSGDGAISYTNQYDYYRFLGHELFVTLIAFLIRDERWQIVTRILNKGVVARDFNSGETKATSIGRLSRPVVTLDIRKRRLNLPRQSLHADLLRDRHSEGPLARLMPLDEFVYGDFFLFLRSIVDDAGTTRGWAPWSTVFLSELPSYLVEAESKDYATILMAALGVSDAAILRLRLIERLPEIQSVAGYGVLSRLSPYDPNIIATR